jgi:hypothetical protein
MARFAYNRFAYKLFKGELGDLASDDLRMMLVKDTFVEDRADNVVDDIVAYECDATNYARKTISTSGRTVTEDDTNNRAELDFADQVWSSLGGAANNDLAGAVVYVHHASGDGSAELLFFMPFTVSTNGSDLTVQINAEGAAWLSCPTA